MDVNQHYLFEARQMQALSLAVHIPLVLLRDRVPGDRAVRASGGTCGPGTSCTGPSRGGGRGSCSRCSRSGS